jgi:carbamoylphosphate synthase small subunit
MVLGIGQADRRILTRVIREKGQTMVQKVRENARQEESTTRKHI